MLEIGGARQDSAVGVTVGRKGLSALENSVTGAESVVQKYGLTRQGAWLHPHSHILMPVLQLQSWVKEEKGNRACS